MKLVRLGIMNKPKHNPITFLIVLSVVLIISTPLASIHPVVAQTEPPQSYEKNFAWNYDGRQWTWNLSIPTDLYDAYQAVPDSRRTRDGPAGYGYLTTTHDYYLQILAQKLNETTNQMGYGSYDKVSFILAFVQSLPYTSDSVTTNYDEFPRFPIETLVDDGGDCEDTSILFASLTLILGYGTVYINPPNHYAVGVLGTDLRGTYWNYPPDSNRTYYYCETTGSGFKIGQLPTEFQGRNASIYAIDESKQFTPEIAVVPTPQPTPTEAPITSATPPQRSNPTNAPDVTDPTVKPVLPLSFNLIADNPTLFIMIIFAISVSFGLAIWSVRRPRHRSIRLSPLTSSEIHGSESSKYCIHCGAANKSYAAFCEKCGKQIT
jgi:hypothetical protein